MTLWLRGADEESRAQAQRLLKRGLSIVRQDEGQVTYSVLGEGRYPRLTLQGEASCDCDTFVEKGLCEHITAAAMAAQESGLWMQMMHRRARACGPHLMAAMDRALPESGSVRLEITLRLVPPGEEGAGLYISLKIGESRLYVVRSITRLLLAMRSGESLEFGKGFVFEPRWMRFSPPEQEVLRLLDMLLQAETGMAEAAALVDRRELRLPDRFAVQVLQAAEPLIFYLELPGKDPRRMEGISHEQPPMKFRVSGSLRAMAITAGLPEASMPLTTDFSYFAMQGRVAALDASHRHLMQTLWQNRTDDRAVFEFSAEDTPRVVGELIPYLRAAGVVEVDSALDRLLVRRPLQSEVYLDRDGMEIIARTRFKYGDTVIDPFDASTIPGLQPGGSFLLRDGAKERQVLDALGFSGFYVRRGQVYLEGDERIYRFISEGVQHLQSLCDVYLSRDFKKMTLRKPALRANMRMNKHRLELVFQDEDEPTEEMLSILAALSRRRNYFRLKDGSFLDLTGMDEWRELAEAVTESAAADGAEMHGDTISLSAHRGFYLHTLLENAALPVQEDDSVRQVVDRLTGVEEQHFQVPSDVGLRPYQLRGFEWLMTLDSLHMGGVLADDMGLGKTVQAIAMLKATRVPGRISLIVAPTSLIYNWLSEFERFAPELSVMVMGGSSAQRAAQIDHVRRANDMDILITSYPLIRRDIRLLKDIPFRFAILDEAQHIKNAGSVGARAVKQIKAETRFALTGTPMENGTGELWSIFDFVLPGYLFSYNAFLKRYQDGEELDDLRRRIRPFLLRRLKKDVLTELPDKLESTLTAQMTPEQDKVYRSALLRLRERVRQIMDDKGIAHGRTEVLSAMTELRQICCHPALVLPDYTGSSGKVELLLDILPGVIGAGHRILLFSQFTSMLKILRRKLEEAGYLCMYLDGNTPPENRLEMTEQFNGGQGQIFLISLKAGGTGLNLTGADMVIHYDPWWNPAAENQATDRAHRIGQTNKVEVVRLVTHGSIEEQVVALGQRKQALFDQLITPGEELVTALSEQDIRSLFEG